MYTNDVAGLDCSIYICELVDLSNSVTVFVIVILVVVAQLGVWSFWQASCVPLFIKCKYPRIALSSYRSSFVGEDS